MNIKNIDSKPLAKPSEAEAALAQVTKLACRASVLANEIANAKEFIAKAEGELSQLRKEYQTTLAAFASALAPLEAKSK